MFAWYTHVVPGTCHTLAVSDAPEGQPQRARPVLPRSFLDESERRLRAYTGPALPISWRIIAPCPTCKPGFILPPSITLFDPVIHLQEGTRHKRFLVGDAAHPSCDSPNTSRRVALWCKQCLAWSVKARRAPSRHCREATEGSGHIHTTTAMHDMNTPPPPPLPPTIDGSEKAIAMLGGRWWPQTAKQEGNTMSKKT